MKMKTKSPLAGVTYGSVYGSRSFSVPAAAKDVKEELGKAASFVPETRQKKATLTRNANSTRR